MRVRRLFAAAAIAAALAGGQAAAGVPSVIYAGTGGASATSQPLVLTGGCAAGNAAVAFIRFEDNLFVSGVSDLANGAWSTTTSRDSGSHRGLSAAKILTTALSPGDAVTVSFTLASVITAQILCVPGITAADTAASANSTGTTTGGAGNITFATTPVTTVVGAFVQDQRNFSGPAGWTLLQNVTPSGDFNVLRTYYRTADSTSPLTFTYNTSPSGQHIWEYHTFTESAAAPAIPPRLTTLGVGW